CTDAVAAKATLQLTGSVVDGNVASVQAGGVFASRTNLTMTGSLISRNQANGSGFGGGVTIASGSVGNLTSTRIAGNSAAALGGGMFVDINSVANVSGSTFFANTAPTNGGGAIFVGSTGSNTGSIASNLIIDNTGTAIVEQCPPNGTRLS